MLGSVGGGGLTRGHGRAYTGTKVETPDTAKEVLQRAVSPPYPDPLTQYTRSTAAPL